MTRLTKLSVTGVSVLMALSAASPGEAQNKLTYASFMPEAHLAHVYGLNPFVKEIGEATKGSLTIQLFTGGAMGNAKSILSLVRDRVVDSGTIADAYVKSDVPASAMLTEMTVLGPDALTMAGAVNEMQLLNCKQCVAELSKVNIRALAYYSTDSYRLMCTRPIVNLADVKGLKIRATSSYGFLAKSLGGTPVSITAEEINEALARGQADCTMSGAAHLDSYGLKDVVKSVLDLPLGTFHGVLVFPINVESWKKLTADEQKALVKAMPRLVRRLAEAYEHEAAVGLANAEKAGIRLTKPGADLLAQFEKHRSGETARVIAKAKEANIEDSEQMIARFTQLVDKWKKIVAGLEGDPKKFDKFEQALWDEVYSKI